MDFRFSVFFDDYTEYLTFLDIHKQLLLYTDDYFHCIALPSGRYQIIVYKTAKNGGDSP